MKTLRSALALALLAAPAGLVSAESPTPAGSVSFLAGEATRATAAEAPVKLEPGSLVYENDLIETGARSRLEIRLLDQSALRIGPRSKVQLVTAVFGKSADERQVNARLVVGNVWAKVAHAVSGSSKFEVQTENAVAGVRGTTFRVDARHDRSCVVKVYAGTVAVAGSSLPRPSHGDGGTAEPGRPGKRVQVPGPQQVTREQWERQVSAMMQVRVSADGKPSEVESFGLAAAGQDDWETWNRARDNQ